MCNIRLKHILCSSVRTVILAVGVLGLIVVHSINIAQLVRV